MAQLFKPSANTLSRGSMMALGIAPLVLFYAGSTISRSPYNTKQGVPLNQPVPFSHKHHVKELGIDCRFCHTGVETSPVAGIPPVETCMTCHSQIWTNSPLLEPVRKAYETGEPLAFANGDEGWNVVNKVPEFVYFDHSIHINRGVNCNQCHGPVQEMHITYKGKPFAMAWCLECHRDPAKFVYADPERKDLSPREQVFELYRKIQNEDRLSAREEDIAKGNMGIRSGDEVLDEKQLEALYKLKKKQLEDCWTCHR